MKLKYILIISFVLIAALPVYLALEFFDSYVAQSNRQLVIERLTGLSQIAKTRIQAAVDRVRDNHRLISSRTQMRVSLEALNTSREEQHAEKIVRIISDASKESDYIDNIIVYDIAYQPVAMVQPDSRQIPRRVNADDKLFFHLDSLQQKMTLTVQSSLKSENGRIGYIATVFTPTFILDLSMTEPDLVKPVNGPLLSGKKMVMPCLPCR